MRKKCIIWLFLLAVFTANFSGLFVYIGFELNKEYITSNLCVNRNKPWMNCNGKCYLMKKVKEAEKEENNRDARDSLRQLSISFYQHIYAPFLNREESMQDRKIAYPGYSYHYSSQYVNSIFRPPKFLV